MAYIDPEYLTPSDSQYSMSNDGAKNEINSPWYARATTNKGNSFLTQMFSPGTQQDKEFAQQMFQIDYQNAYNDPAAQMERFKKAGINPNSAAAGISGTPNTSATPSSVPQTPKGISLSDIAGVADAATGGAASIAEAATKFGMLDINRKNVIADTYKKYVDAGYTTEQARGLAIANAYLPTEKFLGIVAMESQIDNLHAEYKTMIQGIEESNARIKEIDAQIKLFEATGNLNDKLALEAEKRALQIEAQTTEQEWFNNKRKELDIDPKSPLENNLFMMGCKYGREDERYKTGLGIVYDNQYNSSLGGYTAEEEKAFNIAYGKFKAQHKADYDFAEADAWIENNKFLMMELIKAQTSIPANLRGSFAKFINQILTSPGVFMMDFDKPSLESIEK